MSTSRSVPEFHLRRGPPIEYCILFFLQISLVDGAERGRQESDRSFYLTEQYVLIYVLYASPLLGSFN